MLSFAGSVRVFLAVEPVDMRKGFEGLLGLVNERLREKVRSGALFVFTHKRHTRLKILYFDGTGMCLMTKHLEEGTFAWSEDAAVVRATVGSAPIAGSQGRIINCIAYRYAIYDPTRRSICTVNQFRMVLWTPLTDDLQSQFCLRPMHPMFLGDLRLRTAASSFAHASGKKSR